MNDPDDPDGLFADERFTPQTPADSELVDADRLAQLRARIRPTQPLTLPEDPRLRERALEQIVLDAEAHAEQVEAQRARPCSGRQSRRARQAAQGESCRRGRGR